MTYAGMLLIGAIIGIACAKIMVMFITDTANAEMYPVGGFIPAGMIVFDLGQNSAILGAGVLVMGGLFGYYLLIAIWKRYVQSGPAPRIINPEQTQTARSLRDYLN
ncbi:MAG: hypothetical protein HQM14_11855 [SAR324 cluster bacterium]|nr:hypothetical protein [SAR324 cluster bacterium]